MAEKVRAIIRPALLVWARAKSGLTLTQAAEKADVASDRLAAWEAGEGAPTIPQLRKLADVYRRPLAIFYLPEPPRSFDPMQDYRRLPGSEDGAAASPDLLYEIRLAHQRREIAVDLIESLGEKLMEFGLRGDLDEDPVDVGRRARTFLGITFERQTKWRDEDEVLREWKAMIEAHGVLVFQTSGVALEEARGFSISAPISPVIVLNGRDHPRGRLFTLAHEFAHLMLAAGGICDLNESRRRRSSEARVEIFCNRVAGEILVPQRTLKSQDIVIHRPRGAEWDDDQIEELARRFGVSREALARALVLANEAPQEFYARKRQLYLKSLRRKGAGPVPVPRKIVARNGIRYSRTVLEAFYENVITESDLSDFLGMRLKHFPEVEQTVLRGLGE